MTIGGMNEHETIFYLILVSANCVVAYYWALYGFFETGLDLGSKKFLVFSMFVGMGTIFVGGYMQKAGSLKLEVLTEANMKVAALYLFMPPLIFMALVRLLFSKNGVPEYNRARVATRFWTIRNLKLGHILTEEGENLRNFPRAIKALKYFNKAISVQKKGSVMYSADTKISVLDQEPDYNGLYRSRCPGCGFEIRVPDSHLGSTGQCTFCGSIVTAKRLGDNIHITALCGKIKRTVVSTQNKKNVATALSEKALLLRMMNRFAEAEESIEEAMKFVEEVLSEEPGNTATRTLQSLIIFRAAELAHVQGNKTKAMDLYRKSLIIDEAIGNTHESKLVTDLMSSL